MIQTSLPKQIESRMETGPIQFGDDWPGMFIRGDDAFFMALLFDDAADAGKRSPRMVVSDVGAGIKPGPLKIATR